MTEYIFLLSWARACERSWGKNFRSKTALRSPKISLTDDTHMHNYSSQHRYTWTPSVGVITKRLIEHHGGASVIALLLTCLALSWQCLLPLHRESLEKPEQVSIHISGNNTWMVMKDFRCVQAAGVCEKVQFDADLRSGEIKLWLSSYG